MLEICFGVISYTWVKRVMCLGKLVKYLQNVAIVTETSPSKVPYQSTELLIVFLEHHTCYITKTLTYYW